MTYRDNDKRILKHTWSLDLVETLRNKGLDPVKEFFDALSEVDNPALKAKLLLDMMDFIYPKKKHVEHTVDTSQATRALSHEEIRAILKADPFAQAIDVSDD